MTPEEKYLLVRVVGITTLIAGCAALECARLDYIDESDSDDSSSVSRFVYLPLVTWTSYPLCTRTKTTRMRTMSTPEHVLAMVPSVDSDGATYAAAFEALENEGLSEHDLGDAFDLFIEDPRVSRGYMAVKDEAPRRRFLRKQLAIYHTKKCNDGKSGW